MPFEHSGFFEAQVQLTATPRIGSCIGDLRRVQARRRPIGGAISFGDPESQKNSCQVAQSRLGVAMTARDPPGIDDAFLFKRKQQLQLAQVVGYRDACLDDVRGLEEFGQFGRKIRLLQPEQIHGTRRGDLGQAGEIALAFVERGPRFGIETSDPLLPYVRHRPIAVRGRRDEQHLSFVSSDRQVGDFLP